MYSFHSSPEEKNRLLFALTQHGIETTVDRKEKKQRIRDWIQESVIQEEDEEEERADEEEEDESEEPYRHSSERRPVAGHVSSVRAEEKVARTQIISTVKDASNKHINPRTGKFQDGPSEMGNHSNENHVSAHHIDSNGKNMSQSHQPNQSNSASSANYTNHMHEMHKENNGRDSTRRPTKLVDVGSQTSNESQKQYEPVTVTRPYTHERANSIGDAYSRTNSYSVPNIPQTPGSLSNINKTQNTQTNIGRNNVTSRGFMSAFNSVAPIVVPESQQAPSFQPISNQSHSQSKQNRPQSRQSYQHRHNTTALTRQPISRSVHNFNSLINESGYGSLDKLRPNESNTISSPVLSKRTVAQPKSSNPSRTGRSSSNDRIHINGMSHSQKENGNSPFHSDSGGDSPRGSNGFVNYAGLHLPPAINDSNRPIMKDTPYDRVRIRKPK